MRNVVDHILGEMGMNREQVLETILAAGCKGEPMNPFACPVCHYLRHHFPNTIDPISVTGDAVYLDGKRYPLPLAVRDFIIWADAGGCPQVEEV